MAVCIDGKPHTGDSLQRLVAALGSELTPGQKPKCAMGYPAMVFVTRERGHAEIHFCGNVGAKAGYFYAAGLELRVKQPDAFENWLVEQGLRPVHLP